MNVFNNKQKVQVLGNKYRINIYEGNVSENYKQNQNFIGYKRFLVYFCNFIGKKV